MCICSMCAQLGANSAASTPCLAVTTGRRRPRRRAAGGDSSRWTPATRRTPERVPTPTATPARQSVRRCICLGGGTAASLLSNQVLTCCVAAARDACFQAVIWAPHALQQHAQFGKVCSVWSCCPSASACTISAWTRLDACAQAMTCGRRSTTASATPARLHPGTNTRGPRGARGMCRLAAMRRAPVNPAARLQRSGHSAHRTLRPPDVSMRRTKARDRPCERPACQLPVCARSLRTVADICGDGRCRARRYAEQCP